uniref:sensor histidine kinase n=1 Tax=Paenibacillus terrae TaxID=159743 RepID=UPI0011AA271D|nr:sensor histidine kinase [Paenibacillus terrae]
MGRHFRSIHSRLFLLFLCCMTGILILISVVYYYRTISIIHTKVNDIAEKNISQTAGLFNSLLQGYNSLSKSLNSNYELTRLLQETHVKETVAIENERTITNIIGAAYYSRNDITGIHILTDRGKVYSYERQFAGVIDNNYAQTSWYNELNASSGNMVWLGMMPGSPINTLQQKENVFVFGRKLYDLNTHKQLGIMVIEANPSSIMEAMSNVTISPGSRVYLIDQNNSIIASTGKKGTEAPDFASIPKPGAEDGILVDDSSSQLVVAANTPMAGWTIYGFTPKHDIQAEVNQTTQYLVIVLIVLIIVSTVLATLVSRNIASPLKLLIREMKKVEMGNFSGSVNVDSFDEINSLVSSFNRMVHRMDELIETIKVTTVSEKNAQLQALQSQVNPHFLYNTLDMIYWMLDEKGNERLSRVILSLSQMFRYSSNWEEASRTTLRQELEQIRHYLTIIENRLEDRLVPKIDVDPQWMDVTLPKMTIQPIIENAVKYGLEPLDRQGMLLVTAEQVMGDLHVVVRDNGKGMNEDTLMRVRSLLEGGDRTSPKAEDRDGPVLRRGIGLSNVHERIRMMFGSPYGLYLDSQEGEGTTVTIRLPIRHQGGMEDEHFSRGR